MKALNSIRNVAGAVANKATEVVKQNDTVKKLAYLRALMRYVENPIDTIRVFELDDAAMALIPEEQRKAFFEEARKDETTRRWLDARYLAPDYKVEDLAKYEPGTLGYAYYRHMTDNGFSPDFYPSIEVVDDTSYFALRARQTHDIWHVLTGYDPSVIGELALQGFYQAQFNGLLASLLIGGGILYAATHFNEDMGTLLDALAEGRQRGLQAKSFILVPWEEYWSRSLEELRREFNVLPGKYAQVEYKPETIKAQASTLELAGAVA